MNSLKLIFFSLVYLQLGQVFAQIEVRLELNSSMYVERESISAKVILSNKSGADLKIHSVGQNSWLDFLVTDSNGRIQAPRVRELFGAVEIPQGATVQKVIPLSRLYGFEQTGRFSVRANVHLPGEYGSRTHQSNPEHITVVRASTIWRERLGVPANQPSAGNMRRYELKLMRTKKQTMLYADVTDEDTGTVLNVMRLGQILSRSEPTTVIDREHTLHVLFQNTGSLFVHSRLDIHGQYLGHEIFKRSASRPKLVKGPNGEVIVVGAVPFDPMEEQRAREKIHKLSDRPTVEFR